jgi:hypothetical protein
MDASLTSVKYWSNTVEENSRMIVAVAVNLQQNITE